MPFFGEWGISTTITRRTPLSLTGALALIAALALLSCIMERENKLGREEGNRVRRPPPTREDSSLAGIMDKPFELRLKGDDR